VDAFAHENSGLFSRRSVAAVVLLFTALTVLMTWPQARQLASHAAHHQDVYFNMWRLEWFAHAIASAPSQLFNGNIFYPALNTLAYSDAMVLEGAVGAPLLWAGLPPVLVHNLLLLGAIIASAVGMYVLTGRLTGNRVAAIVAGIIVAFAPYRFEHYMHMELQWSMWIPWALWAVHRTIDSGRLWHGIQAGVFVVLQMLSCVYYGVFLGTMLPLLAVLLLTTLRGRQLRRAILALAAGGIVALAIGAMYARPYVAARSQVGVRLESEILHYSARPADFVIATPDNRIYGDLFTGRPERRLFPGMTALLLAIVALLLRPPGRVAIVYCVALTVAFELSLGLNGYAYRFLHDHVPIFAGLRAPARLAYLALTFLAVLAAEGYRTVSDAVTPAIRRLLAVLVPCMLLAEYFVAPLQLAAYDNAPPPLYELLARLPRGVVAEFPVASPDTLPGPDARYIYMSTFHWKPIVNGYSGYYPTWYVLRLEAFQGFPDARSLEVLRRMDVTYIVVHLPPDSPAERSSVETDLQSHPELELLAKLRDGVGSALLFRTKSAAAMR
jgi:hypothetical protein